MSKFRLTFILFMISFYSIVNFTNRIFKPIIKRFSPLQSSLIFKTLIYIYQAYFSSLWRWIFFCQVSIRIDLMTNLSSTLMPKIEGDPTKHILPLDFGFDSKFLVIIFFSFVETPNILLIFLFIPKNP